MDGFSRTIEHCDDIDKCEQTGIIEISEIYTEQSESDLNKMSSYNEFKRIINLKENSQIMHRIFKDCQLNKGDQLQEKLVEMKPYRTMKTQVVKLKKAGWKTYDPFDNFDCRETEVFS